MSDEAFAALLGAIVGACAVGLVGHFQKLRDDTLKAREMFEVFKFFHDQWEKICDGKLTNQQKDYPIVLDSLDKLMPVILKNADISTKKHFLLYSMTLIELANHVKNGHLGQTNYYKDELKRISSKAKSDLDEKGILNNI